MHLRYGDDLMFHTYLSQLYERLTNQDIITFFASLKPEYAYSSFFWIINFSAFYIVSFLKSEEFLTMAPFVVSLFFFILSLLNIFKIYKSYFKKHYMAQIALALFIMLPMSTHSGVRFHNYSMTLYLSSLLFYLIKKRDVIDTRKTILLSLVSSLLVSTKLNGAFIGIACIGLIVNKRDFFWKNNLSKILIFLFIFIVSYIFFMQPNFLWHIVTLDKGYIKNSSIDFLKMIKEALRDGEINYFFNLLSLKDHYLSLYSFVVCSIGFLIWIIRDSKSRIESLLIVLCLGICSSFIVLTGRIWHTSTYLIGISFLLPLFLKGFELIQRRKTQLGIISLSLCLSLYHFIDRYHIMHARDLYISKGSPNYFLLKKDQDKFLSMFPRPDNYRSDLRINCFIYSFCPWVHPLKPMDLSIVYEPDEDFLRNSDYIFINDKRWPDQTKFYLDQYELSFISNILSSLKIGEDDYELIYKSEYIKVLKRK